MVARKRAWAVLAAVAFCVSATTAQAAVTVTVGFADGNGGNCFPFGCTSFGPSTRYQQVYSSINALFPDPFSFNQIVFFDTESPGGNVDPANYEIHFSTSVNPVNALDTVNFDNNVGADDALFFSGILNAPLVGGQLVITGATFTYDPSFGDLLLDIRKTGFDPNAPLGVFLDSRGNGSFGNVSSRSHNFEDGTSGFIGWGLVTQFQTEEVTIPPEPVVPEPATLLLMGMGLVGAGFSNRRPKL